MSSVTMLEAFGTSYYIRFSVPKASFLLLSIELLNSEEVATNKRWKQVQRAVKCGINKVVLIPVCLSS